jgi:hypothetical protein
LGKVRGSFLRHIQVELLTETGEPCDVYEISPPTGIKRLQRLIYRPQEPIVLPERSSQMINFRVEAYTRPKVAIRNVRLTAEFVSHRRVKLTWRDIRKVQADKR